MTSSIEKCHEEVYRRMVERLSQPDGLMFFTADPGLGKTTGFREGIVRMREEIHSDLRFLIMVPNKKDADDCWTAMEELAPGCAGVWTRTHDPELLVPDDRFEPSALFTRSQAAQMPVLIVTHNCGKSAETWIGHRDMVLIDEYPQPVETLTVRRSEFVKAMEDEGVEPFITASSWASEVEMHGIMPTGIPAWVEPVIASQPRSASAKHVQKLAEKMKEGTAFQRDTHFPFWTGYSYDMPYGDHAIVFSATAAFEGWHFSPSAPDIIDKDGPGSAIAI